MDIKAVLGVGLVLGTLGLVVPLAVFWSVKEIAGYAIDFRLETLVAFWILYVAARMSFAMDKGSVKKGRKK
jgi:hypothetical protein